MKKTFLRLYERESADKNLFKLVVSRKILNLLSLSNFIFDSVQNIKVLTRATFIAKVLHIQIKSLEFIQGGGGGGGKLQA